MKLSTQIILAFSVVIAFSLIDSYTNYILSLKVEKNSNFLANSESVIRNSNRLHKSMIEMQGAFRGYLLTDDTTFLELFYTGLNSVPVLFKEQKELVRSNPQQIMLLDTIYVLHTQWINYANELIASKRSIIASDQIANDYQNLFESKLKKQVGKNLNDRIKEKFDEFDVGEYAFRNVHAQSLERSIANTHKSSSIFLSLTVMVGIGSAIFIVSLISTRIAKMVKLAGDIAKGEFKTVKDNRNDELTGLTTSLNTMSENLGRTMQDLKNRNIELNKFAYVVSHDLKAPVRGIRNVVKWLEEDFGSSLTPEMKGYIDLIPERTQRMEALINGLLDYATINHKSAEEEIDIKLLVREIILYSVPREYNIELINLPVIFGERIKLEQVFSNLISNAISFIPEIEGQIIIGCTDKPDFFEFSIKDNGIGIGPEFHDRIFELFQTLRKAHEKESTGIGLAIVKKIIEDQGGTIRVVSAPGAGAEFIFTWPKKKQ